MALGFSMGERYCINSDDCASVTASDCTTKYCHTGASDSVCTSAGRCDAACKQLLGASASAAQFCPTVTPAVAGASTEPVGAGKDYFNTYKEPAWCSKAYKRNGYRCDERWESQCRATCWQQCTTNSDKASAGYCPTLNDGPACSGSVSDADGLNMFSTASTSGFCTLTSVSSLNVMTECAKCSACRAGGSTTGVCSLVDKCCKGSTEANVVKAFKVRAGRCTYKLTKLNRCPDTTAKDCQGNCPTPCTGSQPVTAPALYGAGAYCPVASLGDAGADPAAMCKLCVGCQGTDNGVTATASGQVRAWCTPENFLKCCQGDFVTRTFSNASGSCRYTDSLLDQCAATPTAAASSFSMVTAGSLRKPVQPHFK